METYPFISVPVFKERIWGGQRLREAFGKDLPVGVRIGESWEVADLPQGQSTIANGAFRGRTLASVGAQHPEEIAGRRDFPTPFPLLIKLLDARDILSVQVHPDPATCRRMGRGEPKTECWYIIEAEPGAHIYKGLRQGVTKEAFARAIEAGTTAELLEKVPVEAGQCHFLPAGTAHSIGAGLLIAEIQTPSDTTYRVFDWNRLDDAGRARDLHIEEALESIHFDASGDALGVTTVGRLVDCEYFKVDKGHQAAGCELLLSPGQLKTLVFLSGGGAVVSPEAEPVDFKAGDCLIIPAAFGGAVTFTKETEYLAVTI
ncbi:MAG: class I mannose-6-phosphate isomerase [Sedimentisphaerales bacterium]|nr:class I mannose-6-phosphate isomerase [Sedimentisphaerales bacterium]